MERRQRAVGLGARECALRGGCAGAHGSVVTLCFGVELARLAEMDCGSVPERERQEGCAKRRVRGISRLSLWKWGGVREIVPT